MAVTSIIEDGRALECDFGTEEATAVRRFTVCFDSNDEPTKRPMLAIEADDGTTKIPSIYQRHPHKSYLFVRNIVPRRLGPFTYEVTVYYTTSPLQGPEDKKYPLESPLSQPWDVEWYFSMSNESINSDIYGNPICNSAGEIFDPPPTRDFSDLVLRITRNQSYFSPSIAVNFKDTVNISYWKGFAPEIVRCININSRSAVHGNLIYFVVTYEFQIRRDGWNLVLLDEGYREFDEALGKYKEITIGEVANETKVSSPWPLDGNGHALSDSEVNNKIKHKLVFNVYPRRNFSFLGL